MLAIQGDFREHASVLRRLGADPVEVRKPEVVLDYGVGEIPLLLAIVRHNDWFRWLRVLSDSVTRVFTVGG